MALGGSQTKSSAQRFLQGNFSPAFLYPLRGVWYCITHRYLHPLAKGRLLPLVLLSTCVLAVLFLAAYLPLVALLEIFHRTGSAWVNGTVFILGVGSLIITVLFEALFVDHTQVDIFDAVSIDLHGVHCLYLASLVTGCMLECCSDVHDMHSPKYMMRK